LRSRKFFSYFRSIYHFLHFLFSEAQPKNAFVNLPPPSGNDFIALYQSHNPKHNNCALTVTICLFLSLSPYIYIYIYAVHTLLWIQIFFIVFLSYAYIFIFKCNLQA
jgi:hypothetical protein